MIGTINNFIKKTFGTKADKDIKKILPLVEMVIEAEKEISSISNDQLREKTGQFKQKIADYIAKETTSISDLKQKIEEQTQLSFDEKEKIYDTIDELEKKVEEKLKEILDIIAPEAFAVIRETARRFSKGPIVVTASELDQELASTKDHITVKNNEATWSNSWGAAGNEVTWDMVHYDVQLIGGFVLHQGKIAEMATGEGKTLVATLPVYLNALPGRGVHLVTVNDYLAKRDSEWMAPIFEFHGLTVDCIDKYQPNSNDRRKAYKADITYGTNNEFGFDYLRDNMAINPGDLVQRKHNYAIVDEVDSVLIDDARTPLIISGPTPKGDIHEFNELKPKVERLVKAQKTYVNTSLADAKKMLSTSQEDSTDKKTYEKAQKDGGLALLRTFRGLPRNKALIKYLSEEGVKSKLQKTENFYLQDNAKEMPKVDQELYFVIDEKNNSIELTEKGIDLITGESEDPKLFVLPDIGVELLEIEKSTSDAKLQLEKKDALLRDYSVKVERVHTINQLLKAYSLFEKEVEYVVMDNKVKIVDEQTGRIMDGRRYSDGLHQAIEAKENVKIEAATQTYATVTLQNYFRMYSKLSGMTGTAETEAGELWEIYKLDVVVIPTNRPIARDDRQDFVYKTAREKYAAIIEEIQKLTSESRPVLVGTTTVEISELLSKMLTMKGIKHNVLNAKLHHKEADIVANAGFKSAVTIATNMAGRGTDIKLKEGVKEAGGLAIVGTERHESRRVDRQLRGRAGRQGDPGSSQFFVSLEDNLMRLFGSDRISNWMDRLGLKEGEVIQHSMITKSIERAQKKVEENNFGMRKHLLEYDDVMNSQREVIYKKRRHALYEERLGLDIVDSIYDTCFAIAEEFQQMDDFEGYKLELIRILSLESPVNEQDFRKLNLNEITEKLYEEAIKHYEIKKTRIAEMAFPVVRNVYETQSGKYENIVVPFSDGIKTLQIIANLDKAYKTSGSYLGTCLEKSVTLALIDDSWKEHLREMDDLRQSVQQARHEQKDPLLIYKFESFELFQKMLKKINREVISFLFKAELPREQTASVQEAQAQHTDLSGIKTSKTEIPEYAKDQERVRNQDMNREPKKVQQHFREEKKVGRNDPCPCGSGKKYKQCHEKQ